MFLTKRENELKHTVYMYFCLVRSLVFPKIPALPRPTPFGNVFRKKLFFEGNVQVSVKIRPQKQKLAEHARNGLLAAR